MAGADAPTAAIGVERRRDRTGERDDYAGGTDRGASPIADETSGLLLCGALRVSQPLAEIAQPLCRLERGRMRRLSGESVDREALKDAPRGAPMDHELVCQFGGRDRAMREKLEGLQRPLYAVAGLCSWPSTHLMARSGSMGAVTASSAAIAVRVGQKYSAPPGPSILCTSPTR